MDPELLANGSEDLEGWRKWGKRKNTFNKQVKVIFWIITINAGPSGTFSTSPDALSCAQPQN